MNKQEAIQEMYKGNYEGLHRRIKMNRDNFIYAAIITGSLDLIRDLPEGDEIDMCEGMERMIIYFLYSARVTPMWLNWQSMIWAKKKL